MNRLAIWILLGSLAFLVWFSFHLASTRIYQVDECSEVYVARKLAVGGEERASLGNISLFQLPLSWLARGATRTADLLVSARFLMTEIFWLNVLLMALATGERLLSLRGLAALVGAATLAPVWDYGFEVRHDNVLLTGMLLTWCAVRVRPAGLQSYFITGALAVALQFIAFKAFVYTIPISLAVLAFPPPGHKAPRWKLALAWAAGAVGMVLLVRLIYGTAGLWGAFLNGFRWTSVVSTSHVYRFAPWPVLGRLLSQAPLLLAMVLAAFVALVAELRRRGKAAINWDGNVPEALLLCVAFAGLLINPTPFPYNLLHLVPYAFVFAFRYALALAKEIQGRPALIPAVGAVLVFAHVAPFATATRRHLDWPNSRQEAVIRRAEDLTDPTKDPVFDGIGMVPTRPFIDARAFLHSLNIQSFINGPGPYLRDMLAARPAAVVIPNYRTDGLPEADHAFIRGRYVSLADDFWVLGKVLPAGGGDFEIVHSGRYRISSLQGSDLAGTYPEGLAGIMTRPVDGRLNGTLDGAPLSGRPVELSVGTHRIESEASLQPAVVWVGPLRERPGRLAPADHRLLFYNWY